jgi:quercetin dioxygenase-like cupin family protein
MELALESTMKNIDDKPQIFHILRDDSLGTTHSPSGSVGKIFSGEGVEVVWVKKQNEEIDSDWFSQPVVDLILVVKGKLKMEFERSDISPCVLEPGDLVVLPPNTHCRAYRWPREADDATVFLAAYPVH